MDGPAGGLPAAHDRETSRGNVSAHECAWNSGTGRPAGEGAGGPREGGTRHALSCPPVTSGRDALTDVRNVLTCTEFL